MQYTKYPHRDIEVLQVIFVDEDILSCVNGLTKRQCKKQNVLKECSSFEFVLNNKLHFLKVKFSKLKTLKFLVILKGIHLIRL